MIEGWQASPVRAIPFVTAWTLSPDLVASNLATAARWVPTLKRRPDSLSARQVLLSRNLSVLCGWAPVGEDANRTTVLDHWPSRGADTVAAGLESRASWPKMNWFPPIARVRFELEATEPVRLPTYPGSAWRGLLGHSLRRTVCVTRQRTCEGCLLTGTCSYSVFFESPPSSPERASRYTALPHPFVLDVEANPEHDVAAGETLRLGVNLIGPAINLLPYLIQAMDRAGEQGLGRSGGRFVLRGVVAEDGLGSGHWHPVYDAESREYHRLVGAPPHVEWPAPVGPLCMNFQTPLRIKRHGHFVGAADLAPADLLRNLLYRLSSLADFYGGAVAPFDWAELGASARDLTVTASGLAWSDWTRFSSRQQTTMQMGGLVGQLTLDGSTIPALWPALWLGQWTHVGKGTSFGLGKYRLKTAAPTDSAPAGTPTGSSPQPCRI
jgi:hypothetical protein